MIHDDTVDSITLTGSYQVTAGTYGFEEALAKAFLAK
jgi:hypothetical protein